VLIRWSSVRIKTTFCGAVTAALFGGSACVGRGAGTRTEAIAARTTKPASIRRDLPAFRTIETTFQGSRACSARTSFAIMRPGRGFVIGATVYL
jgi:hypothetical protein